MAAFTSYDTQRLTRVPLELVAGRGRRSGWLAVILTLVLVMAGALAIRQAPAGLDVMTWLNNPQENSRLRSEVQRARLELDMERATRAELERQIQTLGEQVTKLNQQLEFMSSRTNGHPAIQPPARTAADNPEA